MASAQSEQAGSLASRLVAHLRIPLFRNAYALASSSILTSGIGMVYWILAAHAYPASLVGLNSAVISVMMFLGGVAQLNLADGAIRFIPTAGKQTGRFVRLTYAISLVIAAAISLAFLSQIGRLAPTLGFLGKSPWLMAWFTLSTMGWAIFVMQDGVLTGLRRATWVPVENTVFSLVKIALMLLFVMSIPQLGIFASWSVGLAITLLPTNFYILRSLVPHHMRQAPQVAEPLALRPVARYVAGDYAGALAWLACTSLLPIMVTQIAGPAANAYYYLSWQISLLLIAVAGSMGSSLVVEAATHPEALGEYAFRVMRQAALIILPMTAALLVLAPTVLLLFGKAYSAEATTLLRLLAISAVPHIAIIIYVSMAQVRRQISRIILALGTLAFLVLGLSAFLLPRLGILGVGYAWLAGQSLVAAGIFISWLRGTNGPHPIGKTNLFK
jgi:O-antigen/teichoic acid export membrane protein